MPIKPENAARYPDDWPEISTRIRFGRAGGFCECEGECGLDHGGRCGEAHGWEHSETGSVVVLTVAHLNHQPEDNRDENLKAMCQRCHLRYDHSHHMENARQTRRAKLACGDLFDDPSNH